MDSGQLPSPADDRHISADLRQRPGCILSDACGVHSAALRSASSTRNPMPSAQVVSGCRPGRRHHYQKSQNASHSDRKGVRSKSSRQVRLHRLLRTLATRKTDRSIIVLSADLRVCTLLPVNTVGARLFLAVKGRTCRNLLRSPSAIQHNSSRKARKKDIT